MIQIGAATHILKIVIQVVGNAKQGVKGVDDSLKGVKNTLDEVDKKVRTFDMRLLSLLFGGMALQRFFGGMLRSITNTFFKAEDGTSGLAKATTRLHASWEFLKFSIIDSLNTPFFINMINGITNFIKWLSQLSDRWKVAFLIISGGLFIIGGIIMFIGQFQLFWNAVFNTGGFLVAIGTIIKGLGFTGILGWLLLIAAFGYIISESWDELKQVGATLWDELETPLTNIKSSLDAIVQTVGFEDIFHFIGVVGVAAFASLGAVLLNVAFYIELIVMGLANFAKGIKALVTWDWTVLDTLGDPVDWVDRWTASNARYIDGMDKIIEDMAGKSTKISFGDGEFEGNGETGTWAEDIIDDLSLDFNSMDTLSTGYATSLQEKVVPQVESFITSLTGENGLINGITSQGTQLNDITKTKTPEYITSSKDIIAEQDRQKTSWRELTTAAQDYFDTISEGEGSSTDRNTSSVSD